MSFFLTVLAVMSLLASMDFQNRIKLFVAGEVATHDVAADQNLQIEDTSATASRREQVAETQPPVFDLSPKPFLDLTKGVEDILAAVTGSGGESWKNCAGRYPRISTSKSARTSSSTGSVPIFTS